MTWFFVIYTILGLGYYTPSRPRELLRAIYFVIFPFHAILIPLIAAFVKGWIDILNNPTLQTIVGGIIQLILGLLGAMFLIAICG